MWLNHCPLKTFAWFPLSSKSIFMASSWQSGSILLFFSLLPLLKDFQYQPHPECASMPLHKTVNQSSQLSCSAFLYFPKIQILSAFSCVHLIDYLHRCPSYCWSNLLLQVTLVTILFESSSLPTLSSRLKALCEWVWGSYITLVLRKIMTLRTPVQRTCNDLFSLLNDRQHWSYYSKIWIFNFYFS